MPIIWAQKTINQTWPVLLNRQVQMCKKSPPAIKRVLSEMEMFSINVCPHFLDMSVTVCLTLKAQQLKCSVHAQSHDS